jgi:hypothetical protein
MSAYASLETQYKDRECLVAALGDMGYNDVEVHEDAQNLVGYHGDTRAQKANVIVRRKFVGQAANDIGWELQNGSYVQHISQYDSGKHNTKWLDGLKKNYTERVVSKEAKKQGLKLHSRTVVNGKVVVKYLKA